MRPVPLDVLTIPDGKDIRPRQWLFGYWLMRGAVTLIAAPGGTGKTSLLTACILSCASGRDLIGVQPHKKLRVAALGLEEGREEMNRRFAAAVSHYDIDRTDMEPIFYLDGKETPFQAAFLDQAGQTVMSDDMTTLAGNLLMSRADVLWADPLALAHSANENDNTAMAAVLSYFSAIAQTCNVAVGLIHHTRKGATAGDPDSIRGAGALVNHARIALGLAPMSEDEGKVFDISAEDRRRMVRIDDLKVNYSPKAGEAKWIKLESVRLGNETEDYPYGDSVQVATRWMPPQARDAFSPLIANHCLDIIAKGLSGPKGQDRYSSAPAAKGKAAFKVIVLGMREFGHEISDNEARQIIKNWLTVQPAVLREEPYYSPNERKQVLGLFVNEANRP